jgi:hypothetical protein
MELHRVQPVDPERRGMAYGMNAMIAVLIGTVRLELNAKCALHLLRLPMGHHHVRSVKRERTTILAGATNYVQPALLGHTR